MKIIKEGSVRPIENPWWTIRTLTCKNCSTVFQLEESDNPAHGGERCITGQQWVQCFCPVCNKSVTATMDGLNQVYVR